MADRGSSRRIRTGAICLLFYEYFHGDNGAGLGASHQTGWTGIIARLMHLFATTTAEQVLELGQKAAIVETESAWSSELADAVWAGGRERIVTTGRDVVRRVVMIRFPIQVTRG